MRKILTSTLLLTFGLNTPLWADPPKKQTAPAQIKPAPTPQVYELPTPLSAELFQGRAREAYKAAAEIPDVFAGLACYCGCDKTQGHRHLLDCFVDDHGAG